MNKEIIVFDIDGTLIDISERLKWLRSVPKNWKKFREDHSTDFPIIPIIYLLEQLSMNNMIILVSARIETEREMTIEQLTKFKISDKIEKLYLRENEDYRDDSLVKEDALKNIIQDYGKSPILWFDDRNRVVNHIRNLGITVCQVAEGNF